MRNRFPQDGRAIIDGREPSPRRQGRLLAGEEVLVELVEQEEALVE